MNRKSLAVGLTCSFVIALGIGRTEAGQIPFNGSFSGTFVNTQVDTNGDGSKGFWATGAGKSTQGSITGQNVGELEFSEPATCPNGNAGFNLTVVPGGPANSVVRVGSTGDLLFGTFTETVCFDPITGIQFFSGTVTFTGGNGKYEGATGTGTFEGTGTTLFADAAGNFFGQFSEEFSSTIIIP